MTPPHPPPPTDQQIPIEGVEYLLRAIIEIALNPVTVSLLSRLLHTASDIIYVQWIYIAGGLAEAATVTAIQYPDQPLSPKILSILTSTRALPNIRVTPQFVLGSLLAVAGCLIRRQCYRTLGTQFRFQLSVVKDHKLIMHGPYAIVRHPSYTACVLVFVGALLTRGADGTWLRESGVLDTVMGKIVVGLWVAIILMSGTGLVMRTKLEDAFLRENFGKDWDEWAQRVRYRLIPGFY